MRAKKITVISNMYPSPKTPNYGVFVAEFTKALKEIPEFEIKTIVIVGRTSSVRIKLLKYIIFYTRIVWALLFCRGLFYFHFANHSILPLVFFPKKIMKRVIINFHGSDLNPKNKISKLIQRFTKTTAVKAKKVIVPSIYFKEEVERRLNIPCSSIIISPSGGINCQEFTPYKKEINPQRHNIGFVGRLDTGKGLHTLLTAFSKHLEDFPNAVLHIAGGGQKEANLLHIIKSRKWEENVRWYGMLSRKELIAHYHLLDILVFPSTQSESLGLVGLEAMACGVPVIGSNQGGIATYVEHNKNGFLFKPGDANELEFQLRHFYQLGTEERKRLSNKARNTALQYDKTIIAEKMHRFLWKQFEQAPTTPGRS